VGVEKPDASMFHHAMQQLGIAPEDYGRVVMVGTNLERDIKGANALGIISIWLDWAPRRAKIPANSSEVPQFTLKTPLDLLAVLDELERLPLVPTQANRWGDAQKPWPRRWGTLPIETVCHKGANEYAPENTYASAQRCLEWGMDYVEIDVNRSQDGIFYLLHGPQVDQTTNGRGRFDALSAAQIDQLDAGSWFGPQFAGEPVPRLEPFLRWIKGKAKLFLDVKVGEPQAIIDLIYRTGLQHECFFWSSDDDWALRLRALDPHLQIKINVETVADVITAHEHFGANLVEVSLSDMSPALVEACRARSLKVMIYIPEKDPAGYRAALDWGVDLINLNHGDLFAQVATDSID
jgi:glycerophosphoryl diester phosphodiesterase